MQYLKLNNGRSIPQLGIGVFTLDGKQAEQSVLLALQSGYRLIDTANVYQNERAVGKAIQESSLPREEIFLTSKLFPQDYPYQKCKAAIDATLNRLGVKYLDLLLLHQPYGKTKEAWKALEKAVGEGKVLSIGISNFDRKQWRDFVKDIEIKPAVLQNEVHPFFTEDDMMEEIEKTNTKMEAWFPLGGRGNRQKILESEPIQRLARKYKKSPAQIVLRWHIEEGHIAIPGSSSEKHIQENIDIFDFQLTEQERKEISSLNKGKGFYRVPKWLKSLTTTALHINYDKSQK